VIVPLATRTTEMEKEGGRRARARFEPRCILYGLPCADCRLYYPANLKACPVCSSLERVSPESVPNYFPV